MKKIGLVQLPAQYYNSTNCPPASVLGRCIVLVDGVVKISDGVTSTGYPNGFSTALGGSSAPVNYGWSVTAQGVAFSTLDPATATGAITPAVGVLQIAKFVASVAQSITNVLIRVSVAGVALTNTFVGIYDINGDLMATSLNVSTDLQTTGVKTIPLATTLLADSEYYFALLVGGATTPPNIRGSSSTATDVNMGLSGATLRAGTLGTGLTTLPLSFNPALMVQQSLLIASGF
jgi:bacillopeptidase F (M6 metalloprotease family)